MNILIISNFYPPYKIGGYELLCQQVVEALKSRGHSVTILTSTFGVNKMVIEDDVHRVFSLESNLDYYRIRDAWSYPLRRDKNVQYLINLLDTLEPDLVFIWGMWSLSKLIAKEAETRLKSRVVYYLANPWPIQSNLHVPYWEKKANSFIGNIIKNILRIPIRVVLKAEWEPHDLSLKYAPCCSEALRTQLLEAGVALDDSPVIYEGIVLESYLKYGQNRSFSNKFLSLLYVGILAPHKGVHTAVDSIAQVSPDIRNKINLTILGTGHPKYIHRLHKMVREKKLGANVEFVDPIPRDQLPEYLSRFDALLLPSIWEEPLALIMQEGLASGMVVVGTTTGGTKEIITDRYNGLLFPPEHASILADKIETLAGDPSLCRELSENGRNTAKELFDLDRMVDDIEYYLNKVLHEAPVSV